MFSGHLSEENPLFVMAGLFPLKHMHFLTCDPATVTRGVVVGIYPGQGQFAEFLVRLRSSHAGLLWLAHFSLLVLISPKVLYARICVFQLPYSYSFYIFLYIILDGNIGTERWKAAAAEGKCSVLGHCTVCCSQFWDQSGTV